MLNKNDTYLEGLADISKVYKNSADYGLTKGQADEYASALFQLAVDRAKLADTGGLSDMSRHVANQMLDERELAIRRKIGQAGQAVHYGANAGAYRSDATPIDGESLNGESGKYRTSYGHYQE